MARAHVATLILTLAATACANAGEELGVGLPGTGAMSAQVYYDRDFSGTATAADTAFAGLGVYLLVAGTQDTVGLDSTDANGVVAYAGLTPGQYTIAVDSLQVLGDTMVTALTPARVVLASRGTPPFIAARVGFPVLTVAGARAGPAGRKVVVVATVVAGSQSFSDTTIHLRDSGGALRLTRATVIVGGVVFPGDQVRVLGRLGSRTGQPVLDSARVVLTGLGPPPPADTLTSSEAAGALAGTRDADLVRVVGAEVVDTLTLGTDYRATVDDGSGALEVFIDGALQLGPAPLVPGDSVHVAGVLVPLGGGAWQLRPRSPQDITVF